MANTKAEQAVAHMIGRIQRDPRVAYYICPLTESYDLLTEAYAEQTGQDVQQFRKEFEATLKFEDPREGPHR